VPGLVDLLRGVHVVAGLLALVLFWVPALSRKGGAVHRRAGRFYAWAMCLVIASAAPLALRFLWLGRWQDGVFLGYLGVITGSALWSGRAALAPGRDPRRFYGPTVASLGLLNLISGLAVLAVGLHTGTWLFAFFAMIGLMAAAETWGRLRRPIDDPHWWIDEHIGGMIGTGIAAHVAFLNFGARALVPGYDLSGATALFAWLAPVAAGIVAAEWATRHYRRKLARGRSELPTEGV